MTVSFKNKALKDLKNIPENRKKQIIDLLFNDIQQFDNIKEIKDIVKIKSFNNYYRIRKGEYRIGLKLENDKLIVMRILHRKEIYRFFP